MLSKRIVVWIFMVLILGSCKPGERTTPERLEIPFELSRNKIILPVTVGDSRKLRIVLDTGMHIEGLIIYNPALRDSIKIENGIEVLVPGAGAGSGSNAMMTDSGEFSIGNVEFANQKVIVLQDETMKGLPTDGVTGYSLLSNYAVEISYDRMKLVLHEWGTVRVDSSWEWLPITFKEYQIPWIEGMININGDEDIPVSLYIDGASGDALELLIKAEMKFQLPEKLEKSYLGTGLSGDIHGYRGRISALQLGSFRFDDVAAVFAPDEVRSKLEGADGIIGNDVLRRFNVIFDYRNKRLYLKPNEFFEEEFSSVR